MERCGRWFDSRGKETENVNKNDVLAHTGVRFSVGSVQMKMSFLLLDFALQQRLEWMGFALPVLAHVGFEARCWAFCKKMEFLHHVRKILWQFIAQGRNAWGLFW